MPDAIGRAVIDIVLNDGPAKRGFKTLQKKFDELAAHATRRIDRVDQAMNSIARTMRQEVGLAIQRTADTSFKKFERASTDAARHMQKTFVRQITGLERALDDLADNPAFEHIAEDINRLRVREIQKLQKEFDELQEELIKLEESGKSGAELEAVMRKLAQTIDLKTKQSVQDLRQELALLTGAEGGLEGIERGFREVGFAAARAEQRIEKAGRELRKLNGAESILRRVRFGIADVGFALGALGGGIAIERLTEFGIGAAANLQTFRVALNTFAADSKEAGVSLGQFNDAAGFTQDQIEKIRAVAARTPFAFDELAEATRRMAAFAEATGRTGSNLGETFDIARTDIKDLSGLLSVLGQGSDALRPLIKALGDIGARGRLTGEELRQLTNTLPGFDSLGEISKQLGITAGSVEDLTEAGISGVQVVDALIQAAREFPGAAEALDAQAKTLAGRFETLRDELGFALADGFEPLAANIGVIIPSLITRLSPLLENFGNTMSNLFDNIGGSALTFVEDLLTGFDRLGSNASVQAIVADLAEIAGDLFLIFVDLAETLAVVLSPLSNVVATFTSLVSILPPVGKGLAGAAGGFALILKALGAERSRKVVTSVITSLSDLSSFLKGPRTGLAGFAGPVLGALAVVAIGLADTNRRMMEFRKEGDSIFEGFIQQAELIDEGTFQGMIDGVADLTERTAELRAEYESNEGSVWARSLTAIQQALPGVQGQLEVTAARFHGMNGALIEAQERTLGVAQTISGLRREFTQLDGLSGDEFREVLRILDERGDIDLDLGIDVASEQLRSLIENSGGLVKFLESVGIEGGKAADVLLQTGDAAGALEAKITETTNALREYLDEQRAALDPAFAYIKAQVDLAEAQEKLEDAGDDTLKQLQASEDFFRARLSGLEAGVEIGQIGGIEGVLTDLESLGEGVEGGAQAFDILSGELRSKKGQLETDIQNLGEAAGVTIDKEVLTAFTSGTQDALLIMEGFTEAQLAALDQDAKNALTFAIKIGVNIAEGIASGIGGKADEAIEAADALAREVERKIRNILRTQSPSRVMMDIGNDVSTGLAIGIRQAGSTVVESAAGLANSVTQGVSGLSIPALSLPKAALALPSARSSPAGGLGSPSTSITRQTIVEAPVNVHGSGSPEVTGRSVARQIMNKAGLT